MARKKTVAPAEQVGPTFPGATPPEIAGQDAQQVLVRSELEEAVSFGGAISQMETATFYESISLSLRLAAFESAKKSKTYRFLVNPKTAKYFSSLEEFCEERIGLTLRRMQQLVSNRNALGQDMFEQSERLGLRQLDYDAIKALPSDDKALIQRAIEKTTTRDEVLDLLQELAAKHQYEREDKDKKIADLTADSEATGRVLEEKNRKLDELAKKGRRKGADPWPEEVAGLKDDLHGLGKILDEALGKHLTLIDATEVETDKYADGETNPDALAGYKTVIHHLGEQIERLCTLAAGLRHEFDTRLGGYIDIDKTHILPD